MSQLLALSTTDSYTINTIQFFPQTNRSYAEIEPLINRGIELDEKIVTQLKPVYIMNISNIHGLYRSLVFDQSATIYLSSRSTSWIAEKIFETFGFQYKIWSQYLQEVTNQPRTIFPFVHGNIIYYRINFKECHHPDWINITYCFKLEAQEVASETNGLDASITTTHITFYFPLIHDKYHQLLVTLSQCNQSFIKQMEYSYQLALLWFLYYNHKLSKTYQQLSAPYWFEDTSHCFNSFPFGTDLNLKIKRSHISEFVNFCMTTNYLS